MQRVKKIIWNNSDCNKTRTFLPFECILLELCEYTASRRRQEMVFYLRWNKEQDQKTSHWRKERERERGNSNRNLFHSLQWEWKAFARDSIPFVRMCDAATVAAASTAAMAQKCSDVSERWEMFRIQFNSSTWPQLRQCSISIRIRFRIFPAFFCLCAAVVYVCVYVKIP